MHRVALTNLSQTEGCTVCLKRKNTGLYLYKPDSALEIPGLFEEIDIGLHGYTPELTLETPNPSYKS